MRWLLPFAALALVAASTPTREHHSRSTDTTMQTATSMIAGSASVLRSSPTTVAFEAHSTGQQSQDVTRTTTSGKSHSATASPSHSPTSSPKPNSGLSGGAIAGIVVGVVVFFALMIGVFAFFLFRRRKRQGRPISMPAPTLFMSGGRSGGRSLGTAKEADTESKAESPSPVAIIPNTPQELPTSRDAALPSPKGFGPTPLHMDESAGQVNAPFSAPSSSHGPPHATVL